MKKKHLYLPSGYLNVPYLMENGRTYIEMIGGRGIGKTYGALEYVIERNMRFLFLRRTQSQVDLITKPKYNPFKWHNKDHGWTINPFSDGNGGYEFFSSFRDENNKLKPISEESWGSCGALSTFANIRGFNGNDIGIIIFDEFVKEKHQSNLKGEADAFFNLMETVGRNRELDGSPPCRGILLSNSTEAANPIFMELGIVTRVMNAQKNNEDYVDIPERDLMVVLPHDSPISERKKSTSLYKLTQGTAFSRSALDNEFINNTPTAVHPRPIKEYKPVCAVGEICIYQHKSNKRLYVSSHMSGCPEAYGCSEKELEIFRRRHPSFQMGVYQHRVDYESYVCELLFDKYLKACYT